MARRTGPFDCEEALTGAHLTHATASRTCGRFCSRARTRPAAGFAANTGRHANLCRLALKRIGQRNLKIVTQVGTALARCSLSLAPPASHELAEQVIENVRH